MFFFSPTGKMTLFSNQHTNIYILDSFMRAVQLVLVVPCKVTLYGAANPGPSLSVTESKCVEGSLLHT